MDRKASIQEQTIHLLTLWVLGHPLRMGTMPPRPVEETQSTNSGVQRSVWRATEDDVYSIGFLCFFVLFFLFCVEVDNMMSFTRNYIWEIFVFLFGAFASSVFKDQHKTPIYFLSWKMLSAMCWALPRKSSPPPPQQASSVWLQKGIYLWRLPSGFKPRQLFTSPEHTKPHSPNRTLGSPGCISMTFFL